MFIIPSPPLAAAIYITTKGYGWVSEKTSCPLSASLRPGTGARGQHPPPSRRKYNGALVVNTKIGFGTTRAHPCTSYCAPLHRNPGDF